MVELFEARKRRYGAPRLAKELQAEGMPMNRKTVAERMRRLGLRARAARRFRCTTQGWLYLAVVIDLCTCKVTGWANSQRFDGQLACGALRAAIARRSPPHGVIMHTDRGSVYCGWQYRVDPEHSTMRPLAWRLSGHRSHPDPAAA